MAIEEISRRDFLRYTGAAALGVGLAGTGLLTSCAPKTETEPSPEEELKLKLNEGPYFDLEKGRKDFEDDIWLSLCWQTDTTDLSGEQTFALDGLYCALAASAGEQLYRVPKLDLKIKTDLDTDDTDGFDSDCVLRSMTLTAGNKVFEQKFDNPHKIDQPQLMISVDDKGEKVFCVVLRTERQSTGKVTWYHTKLSPDESGWGKSLIREYSKDWDPLSEGMRPVPRADKGQVFGPGGLWLKDFWRVITYQQEKPEDFSHLSPGAYYKEGNPEKIVLEQFYTEKELRGFVEIWPKLRKDDCHLITDGVPLSFVSGQKGEVFHFDPVFHQACRARYGPEAIPEGNIVAGRGTFIATFCKAVKKNMILVENPSTGELEQHLVLFDLTPEKDVAVKDRSYFMVVPLARVLPPVPEDPSMEFLRKHGDELLSIMLFMALPKLPAALKFIVSAIKGSQDPTIKTEFQV